MRSLFCFALLTGVWPVFAGEPAVPGYRDFESFAAVCDELVESPLVSREAIGRTAGGREVIALTVGGENADRRPAVLVVGSVQADSLIGSHLTLDMAQQLVERAGTDDAVKQMLDEVTFYLIPRPSPDASEHFFADTKHANSNNSTPHDDDRDGRIDEDLPADLNSDGFITQMRVEDPTGEWITHPDDPRVMIKADRAKGEVGRYRLLTEDDRDDDGDKRFAEDAAGGVDFNRNFTFKYPYFKPGAGPHQVSEPESRAVADFAFDHPNIFLVFSFAPQANLLEDWKAGGDAAGVVSTVADKDSPHFKWIAKAYRDRFKPKGAPKAAELEGSFAAWAYFHYGRWSVAAPGWWPPEAPVEKPQESDDEDKPTEKKKSKPDKRGKQDRQRLAWLDREGIDGFANWTEWEGEPIEGLPGKVEIGGFKPYLSTHPPVEQIEGLGAKHLDFLLEVVAGRPQLVVGRAQTESTGGVTRQELQIVNAGKLPTMTRTGERSSKAPRAEVVIDTGKGSKLLAGSPRRPLKRIDAGGSQEVVWVWRGGDESAAMRLGFGFERDDEAKLPAVELKEQTLEERE